MTRHSLRFPLGICIVLFVAATTTQAHAQANKFTLSAAIPDDVFFYVAWQHNPEHEFIDGYWKEVFQALEQSGIGDDLLGLFGSLLGEEGPSEVARLKDRAAKLLEGVDWKELCNGEVVLAERLVPLRGLSRNRAGILTNMVWLVRGSGNKTKRNYEGLVSILQALTEEVNKAKGAEALTVVRSVENGTEIASVNMLAMVPDAPPLPLAVARRNDVVFVAFGEQLTQDVIGLLSGTGDHRSLADDPRFQSAFARLPAADDSMMFFNTQALLQQLGSFTDMLVEAVESPKDVYIKTKISSKAVRFHERSLVAYRRGDFAEALRQTERSFEVAPNDSFTLYNLACFNALTGNKEEALGWLEKAVDGGFYAPNKIANDPDFNSLRDEPRYRDTLAKAAKKARARSVEDIVIKSTKKGEAYKLRMAARRINEHHRDHVQSLRIVEQAFELAPNDSAVLYELAISHSRLGHEKRALIFLEKAVDGGYYCPTHISKDPDLKRIRSTKRFDVVLARAREHAIEMATKQASGKLTLVKGIVDRVLDAVGVIDYVATVETTQGHSVRAETVAALVPGAESRPIYRVFGARQPLRNFDRYLPQETLSFSVSNGFDLAALYSYLEDTVREAGPNGQELLGKWNEIQTKIGFDLKKDILGWLEGEVVSVTLEEHRGWVVLLKVTDEQTARDKVADTLDLLARELGGIAAVIPPLGMLTFSRSPVQHEQLDGFENLRLMVSPTPIVWGVADGHLIVGASADAVALCLDTARGGHPNIRQNPRVMTEALLPPEPFTSVTLSDRRHLGDQLAMGFGMVSMIGGPISMGIEDQESRTMLARIVGMVAKLPPVVSKIDFYKSTAAYTTFDGRAWRTHKITHYMSPEEHATHKPPPAPKAPQATQGL